MSTMQSDTPGGVLSSITAYQQSKKLAEAAEKNREAVQSLRELADWIEAHPELPGLVHGYACFRYQGHDQTARDTLATVAAALGDKATEKTDGGRVEIEGKFGPVRVIASASPDELGAVPVRPAYEPILGGAA